MHKDVDRSEKTKLSNLPFPVALLITLIMGVFYTWVDLRQFPEPTQSLLAFIPGLASLGVLFAAGLRRDKLNLQLASLSGAGAGALGITTILLLPILVSSSAYIGWRWVPALVYAPASGIAQELYFRSALLGGLERAMPGRKVAALITHSLVFIGFHLRTFLSLPSLGIGIVVGTVLFLAGCGWGWQVQRDRTILWAALQHSLFLMVMSMFDWA